MVGKGTRDTAAQPDAEGATGHLYRVDLPPRSRWLRRTPIEALCAELVGRADDGAFDQETVVHLGFAVQETLASALDVHRNRFSTRRYRDLFGEIYRGLGPVHFDLEGATVVDMGCGALNPFGLLFVLLMAGARRGIAVDPDGIEDRPRALRALASVAATALVDPRAIFGDFGIDARRILDRIASFDLAQLAAGRDRGLDAARLNHLQESLASPSLVEEADLVLSNSLLEHVDDIDEAISGFAGITKPGGLGMHRIDSSDHRRYSQRHGAHDHLTIESSDTLVYGANRLRPFEFVALFEKHGFEVLEFAPFERIELEKKLRRRLVAPFRSMPDEILTVVGARLVVRRTAARRGIRWTDPSGRIRRSVQAGRDLVARGEHAAAVQQVEEPPETHPEFYSAMVLRGMAYKHLGDRRNALSAFDRAVEKAGERPEALVQRAWLHLECDRNDEAWEDTMAAQRLLQPGGPHESDLRGLLAFLLARRGQHDEALKHTDSLLRLRPGHADARVTRGWVLQMAGRSTEAEAEVELALTSEPSHRGALRLAEVLAAQRPEGEKLGAP